MRLNLEYPVLPVELYADIAYMSRRISGSACIFTVLGDGTVLIDTDERGSEAEKYNILESGFSPILFVLLIHASK